MHSGGRSCVQFMLADECMCAHCSAVAIGDRSVDHIWANAEPEGSKEGTTVAVYVACGPCSRPSNSSIGVIRAVREQGRKDCGGWGTGVINACGSMTWHIPRVQNLLREIGWL